MANKEVIIAIRGGVATVVEQPEGVDVHIRDYDMDGCDWDGEFDSDGKPYVFACECCS